MKILVIDGQGGKIGARLVEELRRKFPDADITAVGTNSAATQKMLSSGATRGATGENAVVVNARRADCIVGPLGIALADSLCGEITPTMANAVAQSDAYRVLIPINKCETVVCGVDASLGLGDLISDAVSKIGQIEC